MKNFYRTLPAGYEKVMCVDLEKDKKLLIWINVVAMVFFLVSLFLGTAFYASKLPENTTVWQDLALLLWFFVLYCAYIVLHELTHGVAYKFMTGEKLCFGFNGMVAWCGVPDLYVSRRTAMISLAAPFLLFDVIFGLMALIPSTPLIQGLGIVLLGSHIGGCAGDLYDLWLLNTRLKSPQTLMIDPGPVQTFYLPEQQAKTYLQRWPLKNETSERSRAGKGNNKKNVQAGKQAGN